MNINLEFSKMTAKHLLSVSNMQNRENDCGHLMTNSMKMSTASSSLLFSLHILRLTSEGVHSLSFYPCLCSLFTLSLSFIRSCQHKLEFSARKSLCSSFSTHTFVSHYNLYELLFTYDVCIIYENEEQLTKYTLIFCISLEMP